LTAPVMANLESLPRFDGGDYLFTSTGGAKPIRGFNRAKRALAPRCSRSWASWHHS
jgi:hypothetical protein